MLKLFCSVLVLYLFLNYFAPSYSLIKTTKPLVKNLRVNEPEIINLPNKETKSISKEEVRATQIFTFVYLVILGL